MFDVDEFVPDAFKEDIEVLEPETSWKIMDKISDFTKLGIKKDNVGKITNLRNLEFLLEKSRKSGDITSPFPDLKLFLVNIWLTIILILILTLILPIIFTLKLPIILTFLIVFSCCRVLTKSQI